MIVNRFDLYTCDPEFLEGSTALQGEILAIKTSLRGSVLRLIAEDESLTVQLTASSC